MKHIVVQLLSLHHLADVANQLTHRQRFLSALIVDDFREDFDQEKFVICFDFGQQQQSVKRDQSVLSDGVVQLVRDLADPAFGHIEAFEHHEVGADDGAGGYLQIGVGDRHFEKPFDDGH